MKMYKWGFYTLRVRKQLLCIVGVSIAPPPHFVPAARVAAQYAFASLGQTYSMECLEERQTREEEERRAAEAKAAKEEERQRRIEYFITIKPKLTAFRVRCKPCAGASRWITTVSAVTSE